MIVEINKLLKRYGDVLALDHVNLKIKEGEIYALLGPNGAGKTTTINIISGLTSFDEGEVSVFDKNIKKHELDIKREIGIVPQDIAVFDDLTAYENVMFFGRLYGLKGNVLKEKADEALEFTGLYDKRKQFPNKYSGGMKRRLNIACAIVHRPKLIIMDEPTVGIDPQSRKHILDSVRKLNEEGSTILYTSHYIEEVENLCSYVAIMDHGRIIASGTKEELKMLIDTEDRLSVELDCMNYTTVNNIKNIKSVKDCYSDDNKLTVVYERDSRNLSKIIDSITASGNEILSVNIEKPSLEGVFLTLTGRTLRD